MQSDSKTSRHRRTRISENVLVLQGGGSLGAFACGVFKTLAKRGLRFDIIAGTSIGAINGAIIAASKNDHPEKDLESFWIELAESSYKIIPDGHIHSYDHEKKRVSQKKIPAASLNAFLYGVPKMFLPRWNWSVLLNDPSFFMPGKWTYLYDNSLLSKTLGSYIDYKKLGPKKDSSVPRFIITAVDVLTSKHLVYDSQISQIQEKHLLASSAYPLNGFPWINVGKGEYAWDGALISNTPLRQTFKASPRNDKNVYIIENYPKKRPKLPSNMLEVFDRASDILFSDKTSYDIDVSNKITEMIVLLEKMYDLLEKNQSNLNSKNEDFEKIKKSYKEIVEQAGSEILSVHNISRDVMENPYPLKNADFSPETVKALISQGEKKALEQLGDHNMAGIEN